MVVDSTLRTRIFESPLAVVDNLQSASVDRHAQLKGFSPVFQVCLPYRGLFIWRVCGEDVVGDANQVLFVSGGEPYQVSEPQHAGYGELIVTPALPVLTDLAQTTESRLALHPLFVKRSRVANVTLQRLRTRFLYLKAHGSGDVLTAEELLLELLRYALEPERRRIVFGCATRQLVRRTKLFLEAHSARAVRLGDVAQAVGASPAYLTDVFRRVEGIPVHKYLVQLRLAKALIELPHTNDLTQLALSLGFSSHSHFAATFRRAFACTPSEFRASTRTQQRRLCCSPPSAVSPSTEDWMHAPGRIARTAARPR